jgi:hypothetical protein
VVAVYQYRFKLRTRDERAINAMVERAEKARQLAGLKATSPTSPPRR